MNRTHDVQYQQVAQAIKILKRLSARISLKGVNVKALVEAGRR